MQLLNCLLLLNLLVNRLCLKGCCVLREGADGPGKLLAIAILLEHALKSAQ